MLYSTDLYLLTARTNLHVGSGDTSYGVIDNLVQRDVLTNYPTIHESSLKGALKEYFAHLLRKEESTLASTNAAKKDPKIAKIFGNDDGSGAYRFLGGHLLTFPARTNRVPFLHATTPRLLKDLLQFISLFELPIDSLEGLEALSDHSVAKGEPLVFDASLEETQIEYRNLKASFFEATLPLPAKLPNLKTLVLLNDEDMKRICGPNKLPVMARNSLVDGKSTNLWYEEIVPRETRFYSFITQTQTTEFDSYFRTNLKVAHVGANGSIGYGLVEFSKLA